MLDSSINNDTISFMATDLDILNQMRENPKGIRFNDLCKVCDSYFGQARQSGSSHRVYKTPWQGDPRVNIQHAKGKAKPYQVRQVLQAIERLEVQNG
ncbi:MAG: toxin HicA [Pseudomonadales bacterium]